MSKEMLIQMIRDYGEACEAYGDYQSEANARVAMNWENDIIAEIEKIFAERSEEKG